MAVLGRRQSVAAWYVAGRCWRPAAGAPLAPPPVTVLRCGGRDGRGSSGRSAGQRHVRAEQPSPPLLLSTARAVGVLLTVGGARRPDFFPLPLVPGLSLPPPAHLSAVARAPRRRGVLSRRGRWRAGLAAARALGRQPPQRAAPRLVAAPAMSAVCVHVYVVRCHRLALSASALSPCASAGHCSARHCARRLVRAGGGCVFVCLCLLVSVPDWWCLLSMVWLYFFVFFSSFLIFSPSLAAATPSFESRPAPPSPPPSRHPSPRSLRKERSEHSRHGPLAVSVPLARRMDPAPPPPPLPPRPGAPALHAPRRRAWRWWICRLLGIPRHGGAGVG